MLFCIDAEILEQMAFLVQSAAEDVLLSSEDANKVLTHDDWFCKEKAVIDESVSNVKDNGVTIAEAFSSFSDAMREVSTMCQDLIRDEEIEMSDVESEVGSVLSILAGDSLSTVVSGENTANVCNYMKSQTNNVAMIDSLSNMSSNIPIVDFDF